jgi:acid phosphatase type 7
MRRVMLFAFVAVFTLQCGGSQNPVAPGTPTATGEAVLVGAGDIITCAGDASEATAKLLDAIPGTVFTSGDNMNVVNGTPDQYPNCYGPTWGRHKGRTRPSPGNHDYQITGGAAYFAYFGSSAGPAGLGYYSFNLGGWHVVSLNSNVPAGNGSAQAVWLQQDLQANPAGCTLAYWHHPLFSSGAQASTIMQDVWRILSQFNVELVLNGHDHFYERFRPQDADGRADAAHGIREFIVGTGGADLYGFARVDRNSEVRASVHGVLKLSLLPASYQWEFVPVAGQAFSDFGTEACH